MICRGVVEMDADVQGARERRANDGNAWLSSWIEVSSLQPLVFQCRECGQRFYALAPKMLDDLPTEIGEHIRKKHALQQDGHQLKTA